MRVLHVEDHPMDADLVRRTLARQAPELHLEQVRTLAEARARLTPAADGAADPTRDYAAVLVDIRLPDGSGLELLGWIRERGLPVAVVLLTGSGDQAAATAALAAGADDYLVKDGTSAGPLAATLRAAIARCRETGDRRGHALRVLYAEPCPSDVDLTRRHLAQHAPHFQLTAVADAEGVLALLPADAQAPAPFDVLLLDYRLPGMDALELVRRLRGDRALDLPVVIVTGHGSERVAARAIHFGVDDYLAKRPGYLYELVPTLEKVCRQAELVRERQSLRHATARLSQVLETSPVILYSMRLGAAGAGIVDWVSGNISRLLGFSEAQARTPGWWAAQVHPQDRPRVLAQLAELPARGQVSCEYRFFDQAGRMHWIADELRLDPTGTAGAIGAWRDITAAKEAEQLRETRIAVLDGLNASCGLDAVLDAIARGLERIRPSLLVSVLVREPPDGRLYTRAAPSLPADFNAAVDGLLPAVGAGSCGTAAATGETVVVADLSCHPYWTDRWRALAAAQGIAACWSLPFKDADGTVLGTFALYRKTPGEPAPGELDLYAEFARLCGLAVQRVRLDARLRQAGAVFDSTREGVVITDLTPTILAVNRAYTQITGYSEAELLGRQPSLLKSGRQDEAFYQAMWRSIGETDHWQGEIWNRRKNGEEYPQLLSISVVRDEAGAPTHYVGVMTDISHLKRAEERLEHLAHYDPLTDLPNRLLVFSRLEHILERAGRFGGKAAVLFLDLDNFKVINDSLGHPAGDALLAQLAHRLRSRLRGADTLGRLGGDEFIVLIEDLKGSDQASAVAELLLGLLEQSFTLPSGEEVFVGASIGISLYPDDGDTVTALIKNADAAMYQAKTRGRNTYQFYTAALSQAASYRLSLEARLRRALAFNELTLHYQPQIDTETNRVIGCEALVRWESPEEGLVPPNHFIPLAEETGLILPIGEWVLRDSCGQVKAWLDAGLPPLVLAVNLSARQLRQPDLVARIAAVLQETGLPAQYLKLELTESMLMEQGGEQAIACLQALKTLGVKLSIDDFGTGYSSLAYLKRLPLDELKIDRSFVRDIPEDDNDMEIAATIIGMARTLKLRAVAEGVETQAQLEFLKAQGCPAWQGYLFSRPITAAEFTATYLEPVAVGTGGA